MFVIHLPGCPRLLESGLRVAARPPVSTFSTAFGLFWSAAVRAPVSTCRWLVEFKAAPGAPVEMPTLASVVYWPETPGAGAAMKLRTWFSRSWMVESPSRMPPVLVEEL